MFLYESSIIFYHYPKYGRYCFKDIYGLRVLGEKHLVVKHHIHDRIRISFINMFNTLLTSCVLVVKIVAVDLSADSLKFLSARKVWCTAKKKLT